MPETERVTAGPWVIFQGKLRDGIDGEGRSVAVFADEEGDEAGLSKADAAFIVALANAAFQISPTNPSAVAAEIGEAFRLLRLLSGEAEKLDWGCYQLAGHEHFDVGKTIEDADALFQRIHSQSKGGGDG